MSSGVPWVVRWLVGRLPSGTRRVVGAPLERTVADALAHARCRGRMAWAWAFVREVTSLARLVTRERFGAGAQGARGPGEWMTMGMQEIRYAIRTLRRSPGVTVVCILTLALGIGANTAIFSVVDGVLLHNLSYAEPDQVVYMGELTPQGGYTSTSYENFRDWQAAGVMSSVAALLGNSVNVTGEGTPERIRGLFVTASYFDVVGVRPVLGRAIQPGEDVPGGPRVAVLSWGYWQQRFGGSPDILGRTLLLNNEPHTIVGVMPQGFRSPWDTPAAWISLQTAPRTFNRGDRGFQAVLGRRAPGQSLDEARDAMQGVMAGLAERYPEVNAGRGIWMEPLGPFLAARNRPVLLGLMGAVALLLLIAAANVANLQLARTSSRRQELAVRAALGGGRRRLLRQVLTENGILFGAGGAVGLAVAVVGVRGLLALEPSFDRYYHVALNLPVALASLTVAVGAGIVFGLIPALEALHTQPAGALREGGRSGGGRTVRRFRSGLVVVQVALSVSLLVGAGLLTRSLGNLLGVDPGFDTRRLLTLEFRLPQNSYADDEATVVFFDRMLDEVRAVPGVEAASVAQDLPFSGNGGTQPFIREGEPLNLEQAPVVRRNVVSPDYFETMGIPLLQGRGLQGSDRAETPTVAVVSRAAADRLFDGDDPLGARFYYTEQLDVATVVGVVGDVATSLTDAPDPYVYFSYAQSPSHFSSLAVRTRGEPMALADAVREAVWRVDPQQPVWEIMPITERMAGDARSQRFAMVLLVAFGVTALLLASLGLYGVMSYSVRRREREIGVRAALGAAPVRLLGMVLREGLALALTGLAIGVLLAWWLSSLLQSLLFGVSARDPVSFGLAVVILAGVAALAAYLPARQAVRVDPAESLQES